MSCIRKGFLIYEEMRKYLRIYDEAVSHIWLCNCSILNFLIYEENLIFFFISVWRWVGLTWEYRVTIPTGVTRTRLISRSSVEDTETDVRVWSLPLHTFKVRNNENSHYFRASRGLKRFHLANQGEPSFDFRIVHQIQRTVVPMTVSMTFSCLRSTVDLHISI